MANRAERRAEAKRKRRGQDMPQEGIMRSRAGLLDEQSLQERSVRLANKARGTWKPTSSVLEEADDDYTVIPSADPTVRAADKQSKELKKERKQMLRERRKIEQAQLEEELERQANAAHPALARSPRWWITLAMWTLAVLSIVAVIVMAVMKTPSWSYIIPVALIVVALVALTVVARAEPLNYYEELEAQERMRDIRHAQQARYHRVQAHNLGWWLRLLNWILIIVSSLGFGSLLFWTPSTIWVIAGIAIAFAVGVLNLFILARPSSENPHVDQYGTAI